MTIDTNIISVCILAIIYLASASLEFSKTTSRLYFHMVIYVTCAMIVLQMVIGYMAIVNASNEWLNSVLSFAYALILPLLPAFCALYVAKQKNPRLICNNKTVALFFVPAALNFTLQILGLGNKPFLILFCLTPAVFSLYVIFRNWVSDTFRLNISYIALIAISSMIWLLGEIGLAGISVSVLVILIIDEIYNAKLDHLTKLHNRKQLTVYLNKMMRAKNKFTLVMFDLDGLKQINDSYGHIVGDEAITTATSIIKSQIRQKDFFARYAGDEFVLIVDSCDKYHLKSLLNRIDDALAINSMRRDSNYKISVSSGYYINEDFSLDIEGMIREADYQMFENKKMKMIKNWQTNIKQLSLVK